ncbi:MAG TPA: hypothetical protein VLC92_16945 [Rhodocyclaceae bacterium]|nr:hypothetical protein [Rhodocyclaceae bacterium]
MTEQGKARDADAEAYRARRRLRVKRGIAAINIAGLVTALVLIEDVAHLREELAVLREQSGQSAQIIGESCGITVVEGVPHGLVEGLPKGFLIDVADEAPADAGQAGRHDVGHEEQEFTYSEGKRYD